MQRVLNAKGRVYSLVITEQGTTEVTWTWSLYLVFALAPDARQAGSRSAYSARLPVGVVSTVTVTDKEHQDGSIRNDNPAANTLQASMG